MHFGSTLDSDLIDKFPSAHQDPLVITKKRIVIATTLELFSSAANILRVLFRTVIFNFRAADTSYSPSHSLLNHGKAQEVV